MVGNTVYIGCQNTSPGSNGGGSICALNASTGKEIWSFFSPPGTRFDLNPLAVEDGHVYAVSPGVTQTIGSFLNVSFNRLILLLEKKTGNTTRQVSWVL